MPEIEAGLDDGGELNFEKPFLQFNVKKEKICMGRVTLKETSTCVWHCWILDTTSLSK